MTNETYRLTLEHYIDNGKKHYRIDEPIVVQMIYMTEVPVPVCINRMLDMMRRELLKMEDEE